MYNSYFGFSEAPFENKLDQRFLFLGQDHGEVLAALLYFAQEKKGLGMVCGDVGTGKTMLLYSFLSKLPDSVQPIVIANPLVDYQELLVYIAKTLGVTPKDETLLGLVDQVKEALIAAQDQGKSFILIVDEAHLLADTRLEHVRLLSNMETPAGKLLQILLVGQYELSHRLNQPQLRQLRQRINVNRFLSPLSEAETWQYMDHRLQIAGSRFDLCFAPECKTLIHKLTDGVPRRINHLCDTALLICLGEGSKQVSGKTVKKAQEALQTDQIFTARYSPAWRTLISGKLGKFLIPALAGVFLLVLGGMLGSAGSWGGMGQAFKKAWPGAAESSRAPLPPPGVSPEGSPAPVPAPAKPASPDSGPAASASPLANPVPEPSPPAKPAETPPLLTASPPPAAAGKNPEATNTAEAPGSQVKLPEPEEARTPPPANSGGEPTTAASAGTNASRPREVVVAENDTLTSLAGRWFPGQLDLGLTALLLANPQNRNQDLIFAGQKLNLPVIDPPTMTIQLPEGIYYALYGQCYSSQDLRQAISRLSRQSVRYTIMNSGTSGGGQSCRVVIGAYGTREDLEQALLRVKEGSG